MKELELLLAPNVVAVIGASGDPGRIGGRPIAIMQRSRFAGRILPVNPHRAEVQGLPCYPSIDDLPQAPDAALIAVAPAEAIKAVEALGKRGCKMATLFTAGFAELGAEGQAQQHQLVETARRYGMRLLGPNTLGAFHPANAYYGTFSSSLDLGMPEVGTIGIASQSGAFGGHVSVMAGRRGLGIGCFVATGNEADISTGEVVGWMADAPEIEVICAYIEGINSPDLLLAGLSRARAARKPVFILKAGRSDLGAAAARSHTASLSGNAAVAEAVLADRGAIMVRDTEQLLDFAYAAHRQIFPRNNGLGVITVSGGAGIVASDEADDCGLPMPPMPEAAQARLKAQLPISTPVNPVDCTAQALNDLGLLESFTRAALAEGGYGSILSFLTYVAGSPDLAPRILDAIKPLRDAYPDRLQVICAIGAADVIRRYEEAGFLVFEDPSRAVRAIHAMGQLGKIFDARPKAQSLAVAPVNLPAKTPNEAEAKAILRAAGIPAPPETSVTSREEVEAAARTIGYPLVMKILSPDIVHKTDVGGVVLNIRDPASAQAAWDQMMAAVARHAPGARIEGALLARHVEGGVECLMGISNDPAFGPIVVFGLGGIFVEILDDVALRRCPIDAATARAMILSIRGRAILEGSRGRPPVDLDALAQMLSNLSLFAAGAGANLQSIDLNPVVALPSGEGAFALDAVIELSGVYRG